MSFDPEVDAFPAYVYLVTYAGQTETPYTWCCNSYYDALNLQLEMQLKHPDREWRVEEKDVS